MSFNLEKILFNTPPKARWTMIIGTFVIIALFDFETPSEYILAFLYIIPILISLSFLKPQLTKQLVVAAIIATLLNLFLPKNSLHDFPIVINRSLSALSILISAFFMLRYLRYRERLQEQESMLSTQQHLAEVREDFVATLTHDLKTPLLGEEQALQYLLTDKGGPLTDEQRQLLEVLQRGNKRQLDLVQTLVTTYKNDNTGVPLQLTLLDMDEVIADFLIEVQYLALERGIELTYTCSNSPQTVKADALQLKRVLANLIHNALNYTPAGGSIQIHLSQHQDSHYLLVGISDSGPGIHVDDIENIFNRFYQSGEERQVIGTGLGLYLSRQIILAHRGKIWAENLFPQGCKFSFMLPTAPEADVIEGIQLSEMVTYS